MARFLNNRDINEEIAMDTASEAETPREDTALMNEMLKTMRALQERPTLLPSGEIKKFSGMGQYTIKEFLDRFTLVARACHLSDAEKARQLPLFLTGTALDYYATLDRETQKNFKRLGIQLTHEFTDTQQQHLAAAQLRYRRMRPNETVQQYAAAMMRLARAAFPQIDQTTIESFLCNEFIFGLPEDLVGPLLDRDPQTIKEAAEMAQRILTRRQLCRMESYLRSGYGYQDQEEGRVSHSRSEQGHRTQGQYQTNRRQSGSLGFDAQQPHRRDQWNSSMYAGGRSQGRMRDGYAERAPYQSNAPPNQRRPLPAPPRRDRANPWVGGRSGFSDNRFSQRYDNQRDGYPSEGAYDRRANVTSAPGRYPQSDFRQRNYETTGRQEETRPQANTQSWQPRPIAQMSSDGQPVCFTCHRRGHLSRNCPQKVEGAAGPHINSARGPRINHVQVDPMFRTPMGRQEQRITFSQDTRLPLLPEESQEAEARNQNLLASSTEPIMPSSVPLNRDETLSDQEFLEDYLLIASCKDKDKNGVETAESEGNKEKTKRVRREKRSKKKKDAEMGSTLSTGKTGSENQDKEERQYKSVKRMVAFCLPKCRSENGSVKTATLEWTKRVPKIFTRKKHEESLSTSREIKKAESVDFGKHWIAGIPLCFFRLLWLCLTLP